MRACGRRFVTVALAGLACAAGVSACTSADPPRSAQELSPGVGTAMTQARPRRPERRLAASLARWRLRAPSSRATAVRWDGRVLLLGGLTRGDSSSSAVTTIDPATGAQRRVGTLVAPVHDAAGSVLRGTPLLFGGGSATSTALVQRAAAGRASVAGRLPTPRSDLGAVRVGHAVYLVGGYDGRRWSAAVLRTRGGRRFTTVARLPVPVRYPAVVAARGRIFVLGGSTPAGPTNVVQAIDPATGRSTVVAHLPVRLTGASGLVLGGRVLVCGGVSRGTARRTVYRFDPRSRSVTRVAVLARPVSYAAAAVVGAVGYLLGGEPPRPTREVQVIRLQPARARLGGTP